MYVYEILLSRIVNRQITGLGIIYKKKKKKAIPTGPYNLRRNIGKIIKNTKFKKKTVPTGCSLIRTIGK